MTVRNTLCKRTIIAYCVFLFTVVLIWKYNERSIAIEEEEDTLKLAILSSLIRVTQNTTGQIRNVEESTHIVQSINENRLDYWLVNNSRTSGINLTAILAPKQPGKYLVYVCHENCGGNVFNIVFD